MSNYSRRLQNVLEQIEIVENNLNKNLIQEFSKYLISKDTSPNYQRNCIKVMLMFVDHYRKRMNEMETLQRNIYRQLNLELSKKPEEQDKKYIIALSSEIRQNNIHLCHLGISMPVISKMKEKIDGRREKILSLANDYKNSHLLPSSKEITGMDEVDIESIIREREERDRQAEEVYKKQMEKAVFFNPGYD